MLRRAFLPIGCIRLVLALFSAGLLIALPSSAMADGSAAPPSLYVITGKVTQYIPPSGSTIGSISIVVTSSNLNAATLRGARLTLGVGPATKLVVGADGQINQGERGIVRFRAPRRLTRAGLRGLQAIHVIAKETGGNSGNGAARGKNPSSEP